MKPYSSLILALLLSWLPSQAIATDTIEKTFCTQAIGYESLDDLKTDLLANVKRLAVNELFGELITASTAVENFIVTSDQIRASSIGFIRLQGTVDYHNGSNFVEACVTIRAYATEQDREKFQPIKLTKRHCVTDAKLTTRELTDLTKEEVIVQALLDYDRRLEQRDRSELLRLMQRVNYLESGFIPDTETYCTRVEGYIVPVEIIALLETRVTLVEAKTACKEVLIRAKDFNRSKNVEVGVAPYGDDVIHNAPPYGQVKENLVEYDIDFSQACNYELWVEYAAVESRPVVITLNGQTVNNNGLAAVTGGWGVESQQWQLQGTVQVNAGKYILRLYRSSVFPHVRAIKFAPNPTNTLIPPANTNVPTDGLVAYYSFDDGTAKDDSRNGNDGKIYGDPERVDGVKGRAFQFNGASNYVEVPRSNSLEPVNSVTVSAWVNPSIVNTWHQVVTKRFAELDDPYNSYILSTDGPYGEKQKWLFAISSGLPGSQAKVVDADVIVINQWTHLAGTYDGLFIKLYVNGILKATAQKTEGIGYSSLSLRIGTAISSEPYQAFIGQIDEIRIYNRALGETEIQALYEDAKELGTD